MWTDLTLDGGPQLVSMFVLGVARFFLTPVLLPVQCRDVIYEWIWHLLLSNF